MRENSERESTANNANFRHQGEGEFNVKLRHQGKSFKADFHHHGEILMPIYATRGEFKANFHQQERV